MICMIYLRIAHAPGGSGIICMIYEGRVSYGLDLYVLHDLGHVTTSHNGR